VGGFTPPPLRKRGESDGSAEGRRAPAPARSGLLASAAVVPAAFAMTDPGGLGGAARLASAVTTGRVVATGGMAGWQIILIALGAALLAAATAVLLDRTLAMAVRLSHDLAVRSAARTAAAGSPRW
jgi:hypothetical protein